MSLKRRFKKITDKQAKKWFDANLHKVRGNLLNYGKKYSKFPKDPVVKNHFYQLNREYSKLRKYKYKQYRQSLIDKLDSLHEENPKLYWNIVNELQGKSEKSGSCAVPSSTLVSHFKTLSELKSEFHNRYAQLSEQLKELEKINCFNELD